MADRIAEICARAPGKIACVLLCIFLVSSFLSGCSRQSSQKVQGYIEGRFTYMATPVSGILKELMVREGSIVEKDQVLFILDKQPESDSYQAAKKDLEQVVATRDSVAANLEFAKLTFERNKILVPQNALQQSELDRARSNYESTLAQLAQSEAAIASSEAALAKSEWALNQKTVKAPLNAMVIRKLYRLGEYTETGKPVLSLLAPEDVKVIFYVREGDLSGIHVNDNISVKCDSCKDAYQGHITFISPIAEYTPPVIFSNETNYKYMYRVEGKFPPKDAYQLHPGQPVKVTYQING